MRTIMDACSHPNVGVCWNSNPGEVINGSIKEPFHLLRPFIKNVHINRIASAYPYRELFRLLRESGYDGYCLAEVAESKEPERFLQYYRALWLELKPRLIPTRAAPKRGLSKNWYGPRSFTAPRGHGSELHVHPFATICNDLQRLRDLFFP